MKAIELDPEIIEDFKGQQGSDEGHEFFMKLVEKSKIEMEAFLEKIEKETEKLKKQNNEI